MPVSPLTTLRRCVIAVVAALAPLVASAQAKTIHVVVPFPPGGPTDVLGRLLGQSLAESLGATVVVDNKVGAAGNIGVDAVAKAAADGSTIGIIPAGNIAVNPTLFPALPYKASDLAPVTMLATVDNVLVVNAEQVPAKTVRLLAAPETRAKLAAQGMDPGGGTPQELAATIRAESARWSEVVRKQNIKPE